MFKGFMEWIMGAVEWVIDLCISIVVSVWSFLVWYGEGFMNLVGMSQGGTIETGLLWFVAVGGTIVLTGILLFVLFFSWTVFEMYILPFILLACMLLLIPFNVIFCRIPVIDQILSGLYNWFQTYIERIERHHKELDGDVSFSFVEYAMQNGLVRDKMYLRMMKNQENTNAQQAKQESDAFDKKLEDKPFFTDDNLRAQNVDRFGNGFDGSHGLDGKKW